MAGEWIKMRTNLWDDPRVSQLCDLTDQCEAAVIGGLYWIWATADEHSSDGVLAGMTVRAIDRKTGIQGFGNALVTVGWLIDNGDSVTVSRFDEHNGASAKQRAQTAKRVANHKGNAKVTQTALPKSDDAVSGALPREDKRREEQKDKTTTDAGAPADGGGGGLDGSRETGNAAPAPLPADPADLDAPKAAPLPPQLPLPGPTNPALVLTIALRPLGVSATSTNPVVMAWADQGVSLETLGEAIREARETKGNETLSPSYLAPIVKRLLNPPVERRSGGRAAPSQQFHFADVDRSADVAAMQAGLAARGVTAADLDDDSPL